MSYLVSLVAVPSGTKFKWATLEAFGGLHWALSNEKENQDRNAHVLEQFARRNSLNDLTTLEQLRTAPADEVIIVKSKTEWEALKDRSPIDVSNNYQHLYKILEDHLRAK